MLNISATPFCSTSHFFALGASTVLPVAGKGVVPAFGSRLRAAREHRNLTLGQVVGRVHHMSLDLERFTRSQLVRYEQGEIANPDVAVLSRLSALYAIDLLDLIRVLVDEREAIARAKAESPPGTATARGHRRARSG